MKKIWILILLVFGLTLNMIQAAGVSDIPTIQSVAAELSSDVAVLQRLADQMKILADNNFTVTIQESTQTVTLNNAQKQGMIAKYQDIKAQMVAHFNLLP